MIMDDQRRSGHWENVFPLAIALILLVIVQISKNG